MSKIEEKLDDNETSKDINNFLDRLAELLGNSNDKNAFEKNKSPFIRSIKLRLRCLYNIIIYNLKHSEEINND